MSCVCVNAFHTGLLSADEAAECAGKIQKMSDKHPQVSWAKTYRYITYNLTIFFKDRGRTLLREGQTGQIQDHNRKLKAAVKEIQRHSTLLNTDSLCDVERSGH